MDPSELNNSYLDIKGDGSVENTFRYYPLKN